MKYVLDNFASVTSGHMPGVRTEKRDLRHRFIAGFVPHYFRLASESADSSLYKKIHPAYPLVLSPGVSTVATKASKYPVVMIPNEGDTLGKVIYSTDLWEFFIDDSSETSLGIPTGTPTSNTGIDAVVFNGKILTSHPTAADHYHGAINATPAWTATTGSVATGVVKILKNFEDRCLFLDSSAGAITCRDLVRFVLPDFSLLSGLTLGDTFDGQDIAVYQDRYVIIFARKTISPRLQRSTYAFLWNGVSGDDYDQKITLPGIYKCSIEKAGNVYAFTQIGTTLVCWLFTGDAFEEVGRVTNVLIPENTLIPKSRITIENDFFVLLATSPGNASGAVPFYWNPSTGESFFLYPVLQSLPFIAIMSAQDATDSSFRYTRYLSWQNNSPVGFVFKTTLESSTKLDWGASYKSNLIPAPIVKDIHGDSTMGRMQIERVEIEYNIKPPSSSDIIGFTLTTKDEHETETYSTNTATIKDTTANSTSAKVTTKRAIIPLGVKATEFSIDLAVTVATTSWDLIIRRIVVYYQPIALSS